MDSVDLKDLQYQVVKSRKVAVTLITDIYNAEAKTMIKNIKEIENQPISTDIDYKPLNFEKIRNIPMPVNNQEDKTQEQIAGIKNVLKLINKKP